MRIFSHAYAIVSFQFKHGVIFSRTSFSALFWSLEDSTRRMKFPQKRIQKLTRRVRSCGLRNIPFARVLSRQRISRSIFRRCARDGDPRARGSRVVPRRSDLGVETGPRSTVQILGHRNSFSVLLTASEEEQEEREKERKRRERRETGDEGTRRIKMKKGDNSGLLLDTHIRKSLPHALLSLLLAPSHSPFLSFFPNREMRSLLLATSTINSWQLLNGSSITSLNHQFTIFGSYDFSSCNSCAPCDATNCISSVSHFNCVLLKLAPTQRPVFS